MARAGQPILQGIGGFILSKSDTVHLVDDAGNTKPYTDKAYTIYVGGGGDVDVVTSNGDTILFSSVASGSFLPMLVTRVNATLTTATKMVAIKGA